MLRRSGLPRVREAIYSVVTIRRFPVRTTFLAGLSFEPWILELPFNLSLSIVCSYYRLPDGIISTYQMGDEIIALLNCSTARVLLGLKKILDQETSTCLDYCIAGLIKDEGLYREKVRSARYANDTTQPLTRDQDEAFDKFWQKLRDRKQHQLDPAPLVQCAERMPHCVRQDVLDRLDSACRISSVSLCRGTYVYTQVFKIYPYHYECTSSGQVAPLYINTEAQRTFRFLTDDELWGKALPRSTPATQDRWPYEFKKAEKYLQTQLLEAQRVCFRTSAFSASPGHLWARKNFKKLAQGSIQSAQQTQSPSTT